MSKEPTFPCRSHQMGLSLVELMISLAIALTLMIALAQLLLGTMQTDRTASDTARIQESGRNALELLGRVIRQAGAGTGPDFVFSGTALSGTNQSGAADKLTLEYEAQEGGETDCTGNTVAAGTLMSFAFAVDTTTSPPSLTCNGVTVVSNVEDMQITYGLDAGKDGIIESYVDASAANFTQVAAIRVDLVVRGPTPNLAVTAPSTSAAGGYLRQNYGATFTVRNQAG